jgi:hypothetical protein
MTSSSHSVIRKCGLCGRYFDKAALVFNGWYLSCKDCQNIEDPSDGSQPWRPHALQAIQAATPKSCRQYPTGNKAVEIGARIAANLLLPGSDRLDITSLLYQSPFLMSALAKAWKG